MRCTPAINDSGYSEHDVGQADNHGWPGQSSKRGRMRIWHSSVEGGSDDTLDNMGAEADVSAVFRSNRTVHTVEMHGRHQNDGTSCETGIKDYGDLLGQKVEMGHAESPYEPGLAKKSTLRCAGATALRPCAGLTHAKNKIVCRSMPF